MNGTHEARGVLRRSRWAAIGAAVAVSMTGGAVMIASADPGDSGETSMIAMVPCRFVDTREATGLRSEALAQLETMAFEARGAHGSCAVPPNAVGVVASVTAVNQTANGYLTVFPSDASLPTASSLNWSAGDGPTTSQVTSKLSASGSLSVYNSAGSTDVIIDIVAYLVPASSGPGPQGERGATGLDGAAGVDGLDGAAGIDGIDGASGSDGADGDIGPRGDIGPAGPTAGRRLHVVTPISNTYIETVFYNGDGWRLLLGCNFDYGLKRVVLDAGVGQSVAIVIGTTTTPYPDGWHYYSVPDDVTVFSVTNGSTKIDFSVVLTYGSDTCHIAGDVTDLNALTGELTI